MASFVGHLNGQHADHLPEVRMDPAEEPGRDRQGGMLVLHQVGHHLHHCRLPLDRKVDGSVPGNSRRRIPLGSCGLAVEPWSILGPHQGPVVEWERRGCRPRPGLPGRQPPRWRALVGPRSQAPNLLPARLPANVGQRLGPAPPWPRGHPAQPQQAIRRRGPGFGTRPAGGRPARGLARRRPGGRRAPGSPGPGKGECVPLGRGRDPPDRVPPR